jgi:hypothetical protein
MVYRTLKELDSSEGTVQLVDNINGNAHLLHLEGTSILLVPQPSADPNDPLRWPQWRKYVVFINICVYSFLNNCFIGGISSAFYGLSKTYGKSINTISGLLVYPILVLGLGVSSHCPCASQLSTDWTELRLGAVISIHRSATSLCTVLSDTDGL